MMLFTGELSDELVRQGLNLIPLYWHLQMSLLIKRTIFLMSSSVNVSFCDGIDSERPMEAPPFLITLKRSSSVLFDKSSESVKLRGFIPSPRVSDRGPSPLPDSPWQGEQVPRKSSLPASFPFPPLHVAFLLTSAFIFAFFSAERA